MKEVLLKSSTPKQLPTIGLGLGSGKLGFPSENLTFQDGGQLPPDLDNLELTWGIPNWGIPTREDSSDTRDDPTMRKAYLPMHGNAWQIRQLHCVPKFLFVDRSTSGLET